MNASTCSAVASSGSTPAKDPSLASTARRARIVCGDAPRVTRYSMCFSTAPTTTTTRPRLGTTADNNYYQPLWTDMAATPPDRLTQLGVSHADSESLSPYG